MAIELNYIGGHKGRTSKSDHHQVLQKEQIINISLVQVGFGVADLGSHKLPWVQGIGDVPILLN